MWENIMPLLATFWPVLAVVVGVIVLIVVLKLISKNNIAQNVLNILISSEAILIAIFGDRVKEIFQILKDIVAALADQNLTVAEAEKLAQDIIDAALQELDIELSVTNMAILMFVVNKIIEAIITHQKAEEVSDILDNMQKNIEFAQARVEILNKK